jgi:Phage integrase family
VRTVRAQCRFTPASSARLLFAPRGPTTARARQKHVWAIRTKLQIEQRTRDLALFNLAIDSKLRGCDVVALKVEDVAPNGYSVDRATVRQKKTGRPVRFELTEQTRQAVDDYIRTASKKPGEFLFTARRMQEHRMPTRQYARLLSEWIASIGLDPHLFGTHSLRRTKATLIRICEFGAERQSVLAAEITLADIGAPVIFEIELEIDLVEESGLDVIKPPVSPATPWVENTLNVSSTFMLTGILANPAMLQYIGTDKDVR